jgi:hypothetical protein
MRRNPRLFRLATSVALGALLCDAAWPLAAVAQPPPPLPPAQGQPDQNQADPPARVGRIAAITGAVSFHNQGDTQWSAASVNYPVSSGNAFWTEPSAETQLEISDSRIALAGGSEFDVYTLDASGLQGVAMQGETYMHLRDLAPNEAWSVQTPRGLVHLGGEGRYGIVVGTTDQPTLITVLDGSAQIEGPGVSLQIAAGQTATINGTDTFQGNIGPVSPDAFLTERLNAERPPPSVASVPPQVAVMPGGADLYGVGSWSQAPEYGQVWYPPVSPGWVPYREGHWAYVAPWGWTWIDDAPWGFAPFHYGRWLQVGGRWGWTPGDAAVSGPPVYAPALVTFIGIGAGVALGAALASGSIGWVPLGPREPFRPWYHASDNYVRQVNVSHVTNITNINNVTINNYVNRGAATSIPAAAMVGSRPVQAVAQPVTPQQFAAARPILGQQPLRPTAATAGVTPAVAHQLNLAPNPGARPAPGPAVRVQAPGPAGAAFARPALAPPGRPAPGNAAIRPATGGAPSTPEPGRLPLAAPGGRPATGAAPNTPEPNRPALTVPNARPGAPAMTVPNAHAGAPAVTVPNARPGAPAVTVPNAHPGAPSATAPQTARPSGPPGGPVPPVAAPKPPPPPQVTPRPTPEVARPAPQVPPAPHPEPQIIAPPAAPARPEVRPAPPPPRPEPVARPAPPPRPEPAARPAPPPRAEPVQREKKPDQH